MMSINHSRKINGYLFEIVVFKVFLLIDRFNKLTMINVENMALKKI